MRVGVEAAVVDGTIVRGDVDLHDGRVAAVGLAGGGCGIAVPGFVDLHIHGFAAVDFATAAYDGYVRAADALARAGTTAFRPTLITAPEPELVASLQEVPDDLPGGRVLGAHLEGPFISPKRLGMHPAEARRDPDLGCLERLLATGRVAHMTLAPELPGAGELIDALLARGIVVSCGHTDATAEEAHAAFDRGATLVTHLFNAMRPFHHREPGVAGAALTRDDVLVELILDGSHVADDAARVAWRSAAGRIALVTDAVMAAGAGEGRWHLGAVDIEVRDGVARRFDGVLAGSMLTLHQAVRNLVELGVPLEHAVDAATRVPARAARRPELGTIAPGAPADVLVLADDLELERVLVRGVEPARA